MEINVRRKQRAQNVSRVWRPRETRDRRSKCARERAKGELLAEFAGKGYQTIAANGGEHTGSKYRSGTVYFTGRSFSRANATAGRGVHWTLTLASLCIESTASHVHRSAVRCFSGCMSAYTLAATIKFAPWTTPVRYRTSVVFTPRLVLDWNTRQNRADYEPTGTLRAHMEINSQHCSPAFHWTRCSSIENGLPPRRANVARNWRRFGARGMRFTRMRITDKETP